MSGSKRGRGVVDARRIRIVRGKSVAAARVVVMGFGIGHVSRTAVDGAHRVLQRLALVAKPYAYHFAFVAQPVRQPRDFGSWKRPKGVPFVNRRTIDAKVLRIMVTNSFSPYVEIGGLSPFH